MLSFPAISLDLTLQLLKLHAFCLLDRISTRGICSIGKPLDFAERFVCLHKQVISVGGTGLPSDGVEDNR